MPGSTVVPPGYAVSLGFMLCHSAARLQASAPLSRRSGCRGCGAKGRFTDPPGERMMISAAKRFDDTISAPAAMSSATPIRLLLVEDDDAYALIVTARLGRVQPPMVVRRVTRLDDAVAALQSDPVDAILLDLGLPDSFGMETVEKTTAAAGEIPIIVLTA